MPLTVQTAGSVGVTVTPRRESLDTARVWSAPTTMSVGWVNVIVCTRPTGVVKFVDPPRTSPPFPLFAMTRT